MNQIGKACRMTGRQVVLDARVGSTWYSGGSTLILRGSLGVGSQVAQLMNPRVNETVDVYMQSGLRAAYLPTVCRKS